jgi:predicted permease
MHLDATRSGEIMRNLRLAFRTLFKSPFITSVAVLSLALGIGANAAIYSLLNQILLRPLPVHEPDRLVNLSAPGPKPGSTSCGQAGNCDYVFSYPMFRDLEARQTPFTGLAAHMMFGANVAYEGQTMNGDGVLVSGSYFPVLGVQPALGRLLNPADDETVGGHFVAVLSHGYWENRLGSAPDVVGRSIIVNGQPLEIVGVAPKGFNGTTLGGAPAVFVPLSMRGFMSPGFTGFENRRTYWAYVFGRLRPGVSVEQAHAAINAVYQPILHDVEAPLQTGMTEETMARFRARQVGLEDGRRGQSSAHTEARVPLLLLMATAGIVLLIACANIANLLLARGANRSMEMAVRLSLGASRRQVLAQLVTESLVLAAMGGLVSLFVAHWTLRAIAAALPPEATVLQLQLNMGVVVFAAVAAVGTGLLFGLFPALHSTRPDLISTIRANAGNLTVTRGAARFRATLVTSQIALSMALLVTAGLFLRSLGNIAQVDLGLRTENVITFGVSPQLNGYEPERSRIFFERLEEELGAVPGVSGVTVSRIAVIAGNNWSNDVNVEGFERLPDTNASASVNWIGTDYFSTLDVPLMAGREFTRADAQGSARVAVVNEAFARKFGLGRDAVGRQMSMGGADLDMQIIGLVRDAKYSTVKDEVPPVFFMPWRQNESIGSLNFYVRTAGDPAPVMREVYRVVAGIDPNLPVEQLKSMTQQVRENVFMDRMVSSLSASFAALATILAAIGLYGVLAYTVARRTREIGVRMALGADAASVRRLVLRQVALMLLIGGLIGTAAALALGQAAASLLYGVEARDPVVVISAAAVLAGFALAAGLIPAQRAVRVDPLTALRYD